MADTQGDDVESQIQSEPENQNSTPLQPNRPSPCLLTKDMYLEICIPLYHAALKGNWEAAKDVIEKNPRVIRSSITKTSETALHIAAAARRIDFVVQLVGKMDVEDLELVNTTGNTALFFAAATGNVKIAEVMMAKNERLPMIRGHEGKTPLYMAALLGHSDMVQYLYPKTNNEDLKDDDRIGILNNCVNTGLYDVALDILEHYPELALARDGNDETALHVLARKPSAFDGGSQGSIWKRFINTYTKIGRDASLKQKQALALVRSLWETVIKRNESEIYDLIRSPSRLLFDAAKLGNTKFLIELIRAYPDLMWENDEQDRSIFHIAVLYRHAEIFNILYEIGSFKDRITCESDKDKNTMLHLAAKKSRHDRLNIVSGTAFQMQRDLLWFKEVQKMLPSLAEMKNVDGKKPQDLFTEEHKDLVMQGEKWMKDTASHSMLVATLIATIVFAAALTVPGGNDNNTGIPMFLKHSSFMAFAISDAIALFTSCTSILMFFSILTSRDTKEDFLESLTSKLIIGLSLLFVSITTTMIAFSATFFVVYSHNLEWVPIPIVLFTSMPIVLLATLQYPLLADMILLTYGSKSLFRPRKHMLY